MSISQDKFDPLAVVVDWLDVCRLGQLDTVLDLYDERASLDCDCEGVSLTGRKSLTAYWAPKLQSKLASAFSLDEMNLTGDGVHIDYQSYEGKPVRMHFRLSPSGKIRPQVAAHEHVAPFKWRLGRARGTSGPPQSPTNLREVARNRRHSSW